MAKRAAGSSSDLPRGGIRQKTEWVKSQGQQSQTGPGRLAALLLEKRAWGTLGAIQIQAIAEAAIADGAKCKHLSSLAKIGDSGRVSGNCERDLQLNLQPNVFLGALKQVRMPIMNPLQVVHTEQDILYPHEVFSILHTKHPEVFIERLCGGKEQNVEAFWSSMKGHPGLVDHPMLLRPDYATRCVPLHMHGDGVAVAGTGKSWSKSVEVYSWGSCLSRGPTVLKTFLVFIAHKGLICKLPGNETLVVFWRHFCWSMNIIFDGVWPAVNADNEPYAENTPEYRKIGRPIAGGWRGALWMIKGDLDFCSNYLQLEHTGSLTPCFLCKADTAEYPWTDCREGVAKWQSTVWTNKQWEEARPDRHAIFKNIKGLSISSVLPDVMHSKHLGTDSYFYGSVLKLLTHKILPGTQAANLQCVWVEISQQYRVLNVEHQFSMLKDTMYLADGGFPRLEGRAAEIRWFVRPLIEVFKTHMNRDAREHRMVLLGMEMSLRLEEIVDENLSEYCWPLAVHREYLKTTYAFLALLTSLGNHYHTQGELPFNFTIKCHFLLHIALYSRYISPTAAWCYGGEDFMKICKKIIAASQHGSKPYQIGRKSMKKYVSGLGFASLATDAGCR